MTSYTPTEAEIKAGAQSLAECDGYDWEHLSKRSRCEYEVEAEAVLVAAASARTNEQRERAGT